jgi:LemA protein
VGFARQYYNDEVLKFNTKIESVPTNIIAGMFGFKQSDFFEIETPSEREVPKVKF